jgi:hypothetical protein
MVLAERLFFLEFSPSNFPYFSVAISYLTVLSFRISSLCPNNPPWLPLLDLLVGFGGEF